MKHDHFEVIKHRRYTEDKLLFHVPITLGFGNAQIAGNQFSKFNQKLNQELLIPHFDDLHVIGVDRGEKHLAFYSIVHAKTGKLVKQGTLNLINGVDYEQKLKEKADSRLQARQNRDTIEKIADLKEGYISQVVKKLTDLMLEYNAVIVFEDLNGGFKRGRQKIEHSVYQKLELALAKKLSCLIRKETPMGEPGSVAQLYQLAPAITTFGDIKGKQRGTIFYTRANYTSTTDPLTGWRKQHYFKKASAEEMKKQFLSTFKALHRDGTAYVFDDGIWQLYSNVERWRGKRNDHWQRIPTKYDPTAELESLFAKYQIKKTDPLLAQLKDRNLPQAFWLSLFRILDLIMQIRNTDDQGRDIILSPVGKTDERFDSRKRYDQLPHNEQGAVIEESDLPYPTSGDANGAYNIARKGVMMLERIREYPEKPDLLIRDSEWDSCVM
ncbi:MAG: type V CRISPR-associated protein Cas12a/Cpf1 [bacterium]|nr:type V CRISPR-associated protein Cas12a/Cpf1 [bacterium]